MNLFYSLFCIHFLKQISVPKYDTYISSLTDVTSICDADLTSNSGYARENFLKSFVFLLQSYSVLMLYSFI